MNRALADDLAELARDVQRLAPDHRNPELFHELKSEIADRLRRAARNLTDHAAHARPRLGSLTNAELCAARTDLASRRSMGQ